MSRRRFVKATSGAVLFFGAGSFPAVLSALSTGFSSGSSSGAFTIEIEKMTATVEVTRFSSGDYRINFKEFKIHYNNDGGTWTGTRVRREQFVGGSWTPCTHFPFPNEWTLSNFPGPHFNPAADPYDPIELFGVPDNGSGDTPVPVRVVIRIYSREFTIYLLPPSVDPVTNKATENLDINFGEIIQHDRAP